MTQKNGVFAPSSYVRRGAAVMCLAIAPRVASSALLGLMLIAGCESTLETGYKPRPLNATSTDRRAYYAPPFTPEAASSTPQKTDNDDAGFRRPGPY